MGLTKYQSSWEKQFSWVERDPKSNHYANCNICGKSIKISAGVTQLIQHSRSVTHIENEAKFKKQCRFGEIEGNLAIQAPTCSKSKVLSTEEQVLRAEIIRCIDIVDSNCSFSSADSDNDKYKKMFPDSNIAKGYHQKRTKVKYMVQFGISTVLWKKLSLK